MLYNKYPPIIIPSIHPPRQPLKLPPRLDPSCVLCLLPISDNKWFDYSGKGNHGAVVGPIKTSKGRKGFGYSFDGSNGYVDCGNAVSFNFTTKFTVEAWINVNDLSDYRRIVSKFEAGLFPWILTTIPGGEISFQLRPREIDRISSFALTPGIWYHVVAVYVASLNQDVYINGALSNGTISGDIPASVNVDGSHVRVGSAVTSPYPMDGLIDEVRLYSRALLALEIKDLYEMGRA